MGLIVQKFGGTSVGTPERLHAVADRIALAREQGASLVVVVSAMGHTTDELIELAHQVSKAPPHREMDMLLTAGERISMALLCMALADRKVPAVSFTGSQSGIITDSGHRRARITRILGDRVRHALAENRVAIVAGFQGVSEQREITTLGRGGSDTTAVALAATLGAEVCEIYTDVDGVFTADPRHVKNARLLERIPADLMLEMAWRGASILHPRSVELARQYKVKLKVCNSFSESRGSEVMSESQKGEKKGMEEFGVTGVSCDLGKALVMVDLGRATVLAALWDKARDAQLAVVAPVFMNGKVFFYADQDTETEWARHMTALAADGFIKGYHFDKKIVPLSVIGYRFSQDGAALQQIVELLARSNISVTIGSASDMAITVAVPANHARDGEALLHAEYIG